MAQMAFFNAGTPAGRPLLGNPRYTLSRPGPKSQGIFTLLGRLPQCHEYRIVKRGPKLNGEVPQIETLSLTRALILAFAVTLSPTLTLVYGGHKNSLTPQQSEREVERKS